MCNFITSIVRSLGVPIFRVNMAPKFKSSLVNPSLVEHVMPCLKLANSVDPVCTVCH